MAEKPWKNRRSVEQDAKIVRASLVSAEHCVVVGKSIGLSPVQLHKRLKWYQSQPAAYKGRVTAEVLRLLRDEGDGEPGGMDVDGAGDDDI